MDTFAFPAAPSVRETVRPMWRRESEESGECTFWENAGLGIAGAFFDGLTVCTSTAPTLNLSLPVIAILPPTSCDVSRLEKGNAPLLVLSPIRPLLSLALVQEHLATL